MAMRHQLILRSSAAMKGRGLIRILHFFCEERYSNKLYRILLESILPSVAFIILIIIIVTAIVKKKRSVQPVPKWTKNKEEREKKNSSQEKVYKDLIETSRGSFRFPFFWPKGRSTGKKPILLEEGGYLVFERRRENCDLTNFGKNEIQSKSPDLGAAATRMETVEAVKWASLPIEVIKELECKQAALDLPTDAKEESKNENNTKNLNCNPISGLLGVCGKPEETSHKSYDLRPSHTYENLGMRDDDVLKQITIQDKCLDEHSKEHQEITLQHCADATVNQSLSLFYGRKPLTKQDNVSLIDSQKEEVDTSIINPGVDLQFEGKICTSLPNPQQLEDIGDASGKSIKEPQTALPKSFASTSNQTNVQITDIIIHKEPRNSENKPLTKKHVYCNLIVNKTDQDEIVEEIYEELPPKNSHTYANLQLS